MASESPTWTDPAVLRSAIEGLVLAPSDQGYDEAREIFNAMHDRRPAVIVRPSSPGDVAEAIRHARRAGLPLAVRGGGHSLPGFSACDDGLVIDQRGLDAIAIDPERRVARVGAGCTWGQLNDATHEHGLATPGGVVSTTAWRG